MCELGVADDDGYMTPIVMSTTQDSDSYTMPIETDGQQRAACSTHTTCGISANYYASLLAPTNADHGGRCSPSAQYEGLVDIARGSEYDTSNNNNDTDGFSSLTHSYITVIDDI